MSNTYGKFFSEADMDGNGYLTLDELTIMLRKKGYTESNAKIRSMFRAVDTSGDNRISLEEYNIAMSTMPKNNHKAATMRAVFKQFDINGDGVIDRSELDQVFRSMGQALSKEELNRIIQAVDTDQNGTINYEEFICKVYGR